MSIKQKILAAINLTLDDLSEECLVDILLEQLAAKDAAIKELEAANAHERITLDADRDALHRERSQLRSDPLYLTNGQYFFLDGNHKFVVNVEAGQVGLIAHRQNRDDMLYQVPASHWHRVREA